MISNINKDISSSKIISFAYDTRVYTNITSIYRLKCLFCNLYKSLQSVYTISCSLMNRAIITLNLINQATISKVTTIIVSKIIKHEQRRKYCAIL